MKRFYRVSAAEKSKSMCWSRLVRLSPAISGTHVVWRVIQTIDAAEFPAQKSRAAFTRRHPCPYHPGWVVTDVLRVPTFQFSNPVALIILSKADNPALHKHYSITPNRE
jgi:hypothetical protein